MSSHYLPKKKSRAGGGGGFLAMFKPRAQQANRISELSKEMFQPCYQQSRMCSYVKNIHMRVSPGLSSSTHVSLRRACCQENLWFLYSECVSVCGRNERGLNPLFSCSREGEMLSEAASLLVQFFMESLRREGFLSFSKGTSWDLELQISFDS
ncbi:hypothetical protein KP509_32G040600 [Ceratopteris richardii]|uniref:Uncharacterized protein n=1 Tax=Ceratopteris richardii TaxID=49495 RepID=A0A8T2QUT8_CERRI|nr:hypothetical protein KP509_32G040600 [Ceratopteris richardii]